MRTLLSLLLLASAAVAQEAPKANQPGLVPGAHAGTDEIVIPAGTKVPIKLENAISTKSNQQGDPVYAVTTFPVVLNERIVIPPGTYVQGRIMQIKPAPRFKGRAEVMMHFTTLIYPSGYTVMLPGSIENAPAVDKAKVKDKEGTIRADSDKGTKAAEVAVPAAEGGAMAGGLASGTRGGALAGAGLGAAVGVGIAMFGHGNEVKLMPGTTLEVVLQRDVAVNAERARAAAQ
jgi:type IV secretion system protein VirB10